MKQDFSHFTHAYLTPEGGLMFVDTKGKDFFLMDSSGQKETRRFVSEKEMRLLGPDNGFLQPRNLPVAFNPRHVRKVVWGKDDMLELHGFSDKPLCSFSMRRYHADALLEDLEKIGSFVRLPGYFCSLNSDFITEIGFDHSAKELDFVIKGNDHLVLRTTINHRDASSLLKTYHDLGIPVHTSHGPVVHKQQESQPVPSEKQDQTENKEQFSEEDLKNLAAKIKERVIGQDDAADSLAEAVQIALAGLKEANKPVGSFLFLGPTGVGKTQIARSLSEILGYDFLKLDMSEYMEKHSVSRLIGAPPGYVGFDEGGQLTGFVKKKPKTVVLLDEVEKAHPDVLKILLQLLDDGVVTEGKKNNDGSISKVDFSNAIIIMTSNLGAAEKLKAKMDKEKKRPIGFTPELNTLEDIIKEVSIRKDPALIQFFSPELLNRLDEVISFKNLKPEHMQRIAEILLSEMQDVLNSNRLKEGKEPVNVQVLPDAKALLAEKGYDPDFGARPLGRVIKEEVKKPLSLSLLFGELKDGGSAVVDATPEKKLNFTFTAAANDNKNKKETPSPRPEAVANTPVPQAIPS